MFQGTKVGPGHSYRGRSGRDVGTGPQEPVLCQVSKTDANSHFAAKNDAWEPMACPTYREMCVKYKDGREVNMERVQIQLFSSCLGS